LAAVTADEVGMRNFTVLTLAALSLVRRLNAPDADSSDRTSTGDATQGFEKDAKAGFGYT
jgi:hypothetical protein